MLEFVNVTGKGKKFNLNNISFSAKEGFITGIIGPNGAGKTTLLSYVLKEKKNYTGSILYNGEDITNNHNEFRDILGYVSDEKCFFNEFTISENVNLLSPFYSIWGHDLFINLMKEMDLNTSKKIKNLSRGEYLRFQMAFAMAHHSKLYLLDEVTSGMDPVFRKDFFKLLHSLIASENVTIIMTTHIEDEINRHMDYCGCMENGKLKYFKEVLTDG